MCFHANSPSKALRELEEELHTELVPGTEVMTDTARHHFIRGARNDTVLVPQPTDSPHDPLASPDQPRLANLAFERFANP